jgi:hypothetical protein
VNDVDWGASDASKTILASGLSNGHIGIWDVSQDGTWENDVSRPWDGLGVPITVACC